MRKSKAILDGWINANPAATVAQVVDFAQEYATSDIHYTFKKCSTNPNQIFVSKRTNCIGYSALFQSVFQYLIAKKGIAEVKATHKIGQLYIGSFNVHTLFKNPAFKDHDYNVVIDQAADRRYIIDPTVSASFGIASVSE